MDHLNLRNVFREKFPVVWIVLFTCLLLLNATAYSQQNKIIGTVKDASGTPVVGATVVVKGTQRGTTVDKQGQFSINAPADATLVVSMVGYNTSEVKVNGRKIVNVSITESIMSVDEVVVMGYGNLRKSDLTGSVTNLVLGNTAENSGLSMATAMQGRIAGMSITQNSGAVGGASTILIRGANSVSGNNQPLFVIDGVPMENNAINLGNTGVVSFQQTIDEVLPTDALSTINPNEIESIQVLKDASSTAIYGSRGANGVILITTKQGKIGAPRINYTFRMDITSAPKPIEVLSTADFLNYVDELNYNYRASGQGTAQNPLYWTEAQREQYSKQNYNWQDYLYQTGVAQDHQLTISGGTVKDRYSLTAGYTNSDGVIKTSNFKRGSVRFNYSRDISKRLTLTLNTSGSITENTRQPSAKSDPSPSDRGTVLAALTFRPIDAPYDENDEINGIQGNPLAVIAGTKDKTTIKQFNLNTKFSYKLKEDLVLAYELNGNYSSQIRDYYQTRQTFGGSMNGGTAVYTPNEGMSYRSVITASYNKTFNSRHRLSAVFGYEWNQWFNRSSTTYTTSFPNDNMEGTMLQLGSGLFRTQSSRNQRSLQSIIGRFNYSYDNRYVVMFTARADESSLLPPDNRWDFFPALGLRWNISREKFMPQNGILSKLTLRMSYGITGNQSVGIGAYGRHLSTGITSMGTDAWKNMLNYTQFANNGLKWEKTTQFNPGIEVGLINDRITLNFDYYNKNTNDLLVRRTIPYSSGYQSFWSNSGKVNNWGIEIELTGIPIQRKNLQWVIMVNGYMNRNKLISLGEATAMQGRFYASGDGINRFINQAKVGYPIGYFYGFKVDGIYQNWAEVAAGPEPTVRRPGDFKYVNTYDNPAAGDVNQITDADQVMIGSPYPKFSIGLTNDFTIYKNLNISFLIDARWGQQVANLNRIYLDGLMVRPGTAPALTLTNVSKRAYQNRWRGEGTSNYYPAAKVSSKLMDGRLSNFLIDDASYIKLRTITISYTLNNVIKGFVKSIRFFVSANNLLTISKYKGYDPEVNTFGTSAIDQGIDFGTVPNLRTVSFGTTINF